MADTEKGNNTMSNTDTSDLTPTLEHFFGKPAREGFRWISAYGEKFEYPRWLCDEFDPDYAPSWEWLKDLSKEELLAGVTVLLKERALAEGVLQKIYNMLGDSGRVWRHR